MGERMSAEGGPNQTVEKVMSITRAEFARGLEILAGTPPHADGRGGYILDGIGTMQQTVRCSFEPLPEAVLGGLLRLPRARVRLDLAALSGEARKEFVALFDRTFQRGGG